MNHKSSPDNLAMGSCAIIVTAFALSLGDATIKMFSAQLPLWQLFVLRSAVALPVLVVFALVAPGFRLTWPLRPGWVALRSALLVANWIAYYAALAEVPISAAVSTYYTSPLFIVILSTTLVGERIGAFGLVAVALGFAGMLAVVQPGSDGFSPWALLPLVAALLYALAMVMTRTHCRNETPIMLAIGINVGFVITGLFAMALYAALGPALPLLGQPGFLNAGWSPLDTSTVGVLVFLGVITALATVLTALAYQSAPAPIIGTLDFSYLAFAVVWGVVFFAEWPNALAWFGIALITVGGVAAIWRPATTPKS